MLDATGFRLLNAWQRDFPLVPQPFAEIAADCGLDEDDVLARFAQLRSRGLIDRIAPVFRPNTVGASTLAAMRVARAMTLSLASPMTIPPMRIERAECEPPPTGTRSVSPVISWTLVKGTPSHSLTHWAKAVSWPWPAADVPITTIIPAFLISELKTSFQIGFMLFIPFLIVDMVIASILLSLGMMMLPPILISLPFKLMLFVMVDGWALLVGSLMQSFT